MTVRHWSKHPRGFSKYHAQIVQLDGYVFRSRAEARYYEGLKLAKEAGALTALTVHPRYELSPVPHRVVYEADFQVTWKSGLTEVLEIKGAETAVWRVKEKLFRAKYPSLPLRIVNASRMTR